MKAHKLSSMGNGLLSIAAAKLAEQGQHDLAVRAYNTARSMTNGHGKRDRLERAAKTLIADHGLTVNTGDYLTAEDKEITVKIGA